MDVKDIGTVVVGALVATLLWEFFLRDVLTKSEG